METALNASACVGKQPIMVAIASTEHPIGCNQQPIGCSVEAVATIFKTNSMEINHLFGGFYCPMPENFVCFEFAVEESGTDEWKEW